jgi:hypothetical protein
VARLDDDDPADRKHDHHHVGRDRQVARRVEKSRIAPDSDAQGDPPRKREERDVGNQDDRESDQIRARVATARPDRFRPSHERGDGGGRRHRDEGGETLARDGNDDRAGADEDRHEDLGEGHRRGAAGSGSDQLENSEQRRRGGDDSEGQPGPSGQTRSLRREKPSPRPGSTAGLLAHAIDAIAEVGYGRQREPLAVRLDGHRPIVPNARGTRFRTNLGG